MRVYTYRMRRAWLTILLLGSLPLGLLPGPSRCLALPPDPGSGLRLGGTDAYVTFGDAPRLHLSAFTLELWFRRDGPGVPASTGSYALNAVPLLSKGRGEEDGNTRDMNFFLGLRAADGVLAADFEEAAGGSPPGLNHPVAGVTPVTPGVWHHAAATYDGGIWRLYLDGNLEAERVVGRPVQSESIQHAALGSALNSLGIPSGYLDGALDEVRIWDRARDAEAIRSTINLSLPDPRPGLVARWSLDEGALGSVGSSAGDPLAGTIIGSDYAWTTGAPMNLDPGPEPPAPVAPRDRSGDAGPDPTLQVAVADPDGRPLDVTFYGREAPARSPGADFSIVLLPDTQYYSAAMYGSNRETFRAQVDWIVTHRRSRNIAFVGQLGDCVEIGDNRPQWENADYAVRPLESRTATGLPEGIPFSIAVGNHDSTPLGEFAGSTALYNAFFGESRFLGRAYYGGHFGADNDNHVSFFSASGIDFLVLSLEYAPDPDPDVLAWARQVLAAYPDRKAIVISHWLIGAGDPGNLDPPGQAVLNALKDSPNLILMACGHIRGEGRRTDVFGGRTVHTLLSDYQWRSHGGDGWLRILEFSPSAGEVRVETFSPTLGIFETDEDSRFTLPVDLVPGAAWEALGTVAGSTGGAVSWVWTGRRPRTAYEWRATVSDGVRIAAGSISGFTTAGPDVTPPRAEVLAPRAGARLVVGTQTQLEWSAVDDDTVASVDLYLIRGEATDGEEPLPSGPAGTGIASWPVTGPTTGFARIRMLARDAAGNTTETLSAPFVIEEIDPPAPPLPDRVSLGPVWPNPVRGMATISFSLPREVPVRLSVLDVSGREVAVLAAGSRPAGTYAPVWRTGTASGGPVAGVYFVRLAAGEETLSRRILVLR